jgi:streptogramin lyase
MRAVLVALFTGELLSACGNAPLVGGPGPSASAGAGGATSTGGSSPASTGGSGGAAPSLPGGAPPSIEAFTGTFDTPRGIAVQDASTAWVTDNTHALVRLDLATRKASAVPWTWTNPMLKAGVMPSGVMVWKDAIYATQGCSFQGFNAASATVDFLQGGGPGGCTTGAVEPGLYGLATDGATLYWNYPDNIDMAIFSHVLGTIETSYDYQIVAGTLDFVSGAGARDGVGPAAKLNVPRGLALDGSGGLYFADELNHAIRRVDLASGDTRTIAGALGQPGAQDGALADARFNKPEGLAFDGHDSLYIADHDNGLVRRLAISTGMVSTVGSRATPIGNPTGLALTPAGDLLVSADSENAVLIIHLR